MTFVSLQKLKKFQFGIEYNGKIIGKIETGKMNKHKIT